MRLICCLVAAFLISSARPSSARAQERVDDAAPVKKLVISERAIAAAFHETRREIVFQDRRDSVKNGAIIGAVIGGAATAVFTTLLCTALHEPGNPPCWRGVLAISALGAGVGAAAGAGIDALAARQTPRPLLRVRLTRNGRNAVIISARS